MLELRIKHGRRQLAPHDLRSFLGTRRAYQEIGDQVDFMIALLDEMAGDPDLEDSDGDLAIDDERCDDIGMDMEYAYPEWHTLPPSQRRSGNIAGKPLDPWRTAIGEDEEDDDSKEDDDNDCCMAGDDRVIAGAVNRSELIVEDRHPGCEDDDERPQPPTTFNMR